MARPGTFQPGNPGNKNAQGRPPLEKSLTKALRDKADPVELANRLLALANDEDKNIALRATTYLFDRLDGTPIQSLRTQADDIPAIKLTRRSDKEASDE